MNRLIVFLYGLLGYVSFWVFIVYLIGFVGNLYGPLIAWGWLPDWPIWKDITSEVVDPFGKALAIDLGLLLLLALQHSGMARNAFKNWWTRIVPKPIERATYILIACGVWGFLVWQWRSLGGEMWRVENTYGQVAILIAFFFGWVLSVIAFKLKDHLIVFGLWQVLLFWRKEPQSEKPFGRPNFFKYTRFPDFLGFVIGLWSATVMTYDRLLVAAFLTTHILVAIWLIERNLVNFYGEAYRAYQRRVSKILPFPPKA